MNKMKKNFRKLLSIILLIVLILNSMGAYNLVQAEDNIITEYKYEGQDYNVIFKVDSYWSNAFNATIIIENVSNKLIDNWSLAFYFPHKITNIWNGKIVNDENDCYLIKNAGWNQDIKAGECVEFGFTATKYDDICIPQLYYNLSDTQIVCDEAYNLDYEVINDWRYGFQGEISIKNKTNADIEDWVIEFDYNRDIANIWNAEIIAKNDTHYIVKNCSYSQNIYSGQTYSFGFLGVNGTEEDVVENIKMYQVKVPSDLSGDTDEDGIIDGMEIRYNMNIYSSDTDGDGLLDEYELYKSGTSPLCNDTDENGILDVNEDRDGDGLSNYDEFVLGTNSLSKDTDKDLLIDYEEVKQYCTNPLSEDTDGDGLIDSDEIELGFNPNCVDTDMNGILDKEEKIEQSITKEIRQEGVNAVTEVSVSMEVCGNIDNHVSISNMYGIDELSTNVVGLVGIPVDIHCDTFFDNATITFKYDRNNIGNVKEENLAILWYDEENNWYYILDDESILDKENQTVSYVTEHFSTYMLVDKELWYDTWKENLDYRVGGEKKINYNFALVVDTSGSMAGDRIENAKEALAGFVDLFGPSDEGCLIKFDLEATLLNKFGSETSEIIKNIETLNVVGGTNVDKALKMAVSELEKVANGNENIVVLICDGDVIYNEATINYAIQNDVRIFTINVGNINSDYYLKLIAEKTGGEYYFCSSPEDIKTVCGYVQDMTVEELDRTDTDGDGIFDVYETVGFKLVNGKVLKTDPHKPDTDGDGLTDFEEIGYIYNMEMGESAIETQRIPTMLDRKVYIGKNQFKGIKTVWVRSDPTKIDTDFDTETDDVDDEPWKYNTTSIVLFKSENQREVDQYGKKAPDFGTNDYSEDELNKLHFLMSTQINWAKTNPEYLFNSFKGFAKLSSMGDMQKVALDMIEHFEKGNGKDYTNEILTKEAKYHESTVEFVSWVQSSVQRHLKNSNGNIN